MHPALNVFLVGGTALVAAVLLCRGVIALGLMDTPDSDRKKVSQKQAVPSSGGVGFILAAALGLLVSVVNFELDTPIMWLGVGVVAMLVLGLVDDIGNINAKAKLLAQIAIGVGVAMTGVYADAIAPGFGKVREFGAIGGIILAVIWFVIVTNAVNFMDGANGVSMGMAMFACMGFCGVAGFAGEWELAIAAAALAGALIGFLVWNLGGKLFAGDAGALSVGMALGGFSMLLIKARPEFVFIPPILLSPFLVDVLLTLNYRLKRGENFWEAHTMHVYQLGLKPPLSLKHWQVAIGHWMIAANCAALGFAGAAIGYEAPLVIFMGVTLMGCAMHVRIRRAAIAVGLLESGEGQIDPTSNEALSARQVENQDA